jgi:hypothetical protein
MGCPVVFSLLHTIMASPRPGLTYYNLTYKPLGSAPVFSSPVTHDPFRWSYLDRCNPVEIVGVGGDVIDAGPAGAVWDAHDL